MIDNALPQRLATLLMEAGHDAVHVRDSAMQAAKDELVLARALVVLRMLLLKHVRDFSFEELTREVRANLVYREFTRVGGGKVPDDKSMGRLARQLSPALVKQVHQRMVAIAREEQIIKGRKMRVDTTVVETNIHYPTDSSLLGDGVRVLIRGMKRIEKIAGQEGAKLRDRSRSVKLRMLEIARAARSKGQQGQGKLQKAYEKLLASTSRVVGQARRFAQEIGAGVKRSSDVMQPAALEGCLAVRFGLPVLPGMGRVVPCRVAATTHGRGAGRPQLQRDRGEGHEAPGSAS